MADPLSVAASVIAVVGAVRVTIKGLERILSLKNAPDLIKQLSNEVRIRYRSSFRGAYLSLALDLRNQPAAAYHEDCSE